MFVIIKQLLKDIWAKTYAFKLDLIENVTK